MPRLETIASWGMVSAFRKFIVHFDDLNQETMLPKRNYAEARREMRNFAHNLNI
jgi:hypothetical protein